MKLIITLLTIAFLFTGAKPAGPKPVGIDADQVDRYEQIPALMDGISAKFDTSTNRLKNRTHETYKK